MLHKGCKLAQVLSMKNKKNTVGFQQVFNN